MSLFAIAAAPDADAAETGRKLFAGPCDFVKGVVAMDGLPAGDRVEVCFAGRSNVGKSSLINAVTGRKGLARASNTPGRTQEINFFDLGQDRRLVDLPGYGYARVSRALRDHWRGLLVEYFEHRQSLAGLMLVVDIRRQLGDFDWQMLDWCREIHCPVHVLLTKADKLKRGQAATALLEVRKALDGRASVQLFSALKRDGVEEARGALNRFLEE